MKAFIGAIILLILLLVGTSCYTGALNDAIDALDAQLEPLEKGAYSLSADECSQILEDFKKNWQKTEHWIKAFVDHRNLDTLNSTRSELESYVKSENREEILVRTVALRELLKRIPESERLSLENIF
ncbi:MAG: DUF4363 family protein [Clostridia bacterium]|nr:DUF4363 family protein [Clostridia bacterium]